MILRLLMKDLKSKYIKKRLVLLKTYAFLSLKRKKNRKRPPNYCIEQNNLFYNAFANIK